MFTNEKLFRFKMIDSPLFTFSKREVESIENLVFHCNVTDSFWETFCSWLRESEVTLQSFTITDILFGVVNIVEQRTGRTNLIHIQRNGRNFCHL